MRLSKIYAMNSVPILKNQASTAFQGGKFLFPHALKIQVCISPQEKPQDCSARWFMIILERFGCLLLFP